MVLKKEKSAKTFFIYGLFLGLIIGLTFSLLGIPQVIGNSIKIKELNFKESTAIDEENKVAVITVSGKLDPTSKTFDKDFELFYNFAIDKVEKKINEKGIINCDTKSQLTESEKREQISKLKEEDSKNLLKSLIVLNYYTKTEYLENFLISNNTEIDLDKDVKFNENIKEEYTLYFDPDDPPGGNDPPPFDPNDPPGGDTGGNSGGFDWPEFPPNLPNLSCASCGGGTGKCVYNVCVSGDVDITTCIAQGQKILLANGKLESVEKIKVGDNILSYNLETNKFEEDKIIYVKQNKPESYFRINGNLELTEGHEVYVINKGYVEVQDLKVNEDYVLKNGKPVLVTSKKHIKNNDKITYTLTVKNNKNLFVNGILVHNALPITKIGFDGIHLSFTIHF